jgi:TolB protein
VRHLKALLLVLVGCAVLPMLPGAPAEQKLGVFDGQEDVGLNPKAGSATFDAATNTYRVTGGGANVWGKADAFHFLFSKVSGDFTFSADVKFEGKGTELHRKALLMIRQSLDPDSPYADVAVHGDGLTALQYRPGAGVETAEFRAAMKSPLHLTITRQGNEFSISAGNPGEAHATTGPVVVSMQDPVYLGLAVCSHNADVLETAEFSNVQIKKVKSR